MMKNTSSLVALAALLVLSTASPARAAEKKQWVMLTNCQFLAHAEGDGDSFRIRHGTNEWA